VFRYSFLLILILSLFAYPTLAQEEEDDEYRSEIVYGLNFNTNGGIIGGAIFKYSQMVSSNMYQTFGLEIVNVKHPKELRVTYNNSNTFIAGKQNYLFAVRPQYGRELVLFRKAPDEGVQINALVAVGPTLGVLKPYHILYQYSSTDVRSEPYDPARHTRLEYIVGTGGIFEGFDNISIVPGAHLKAGLSFELSGFRNSVTGFEVGFLMEQYTSRVIIMPQATNRSFFTSGYLNLFFGSKR
jgi:hypothetical protein